MHRLSAFPCCTLVSIDVLATFHCLVNLLTTDFVYPLVTLAYWPVFCLWRTALFVARSFVDGHRPLDAQDFVVSDVVKEFVHSAGGGNKLGKISVGELKNYSILSGSFGRLHDSDSVNLVGILPSTFMNDNESNSRSELSNDTVHVALPLHVLVPIIGVRHSSLFHNLPYIVLRKHQNPIADLKQTVHQYCCSRNCPFFVVQFRRPQNSIVNPFHIQGTTPTFGTPSVEVSVSDSKSASPCPLSVR